MQRVGVVAIGRNEGERFRECLRAFHVNAPACAVVYVDSGSTDGSVDEAIAQGAAVIVLDMSTSFTAARARNEGFARLLEIRPDTEYVQFVDGDCLIQANWIDAATGFLDLNPDFAAACGRRRERFPSRSIYNRLIDREWDTPHGETTAFGGDVLLRVSAFREVGGYNPALIAGEEPELCIRLRRCGWKIMRLNQEMTLHDAAMTRFGQWWKRAKRAGFAYALGSRLHGAPPERHWVRETRSALLWGLLIPLSILMFAVVSRGWGLALFAIYPIQVFRIFRGQRTSGCESMDAFLYGLFCVLGKFPETTGVLQFYWQRLTKQNATIIEYK